MSKTNKTNQLNKNENIFDKLLLSKWFYLIFFTVSIAFAFWLLFSCCSRLTVSDSVRDDASFWGVFGDFYGGVFGSLLALLSVLLMVRTFRHQREITAQNNIQLETQRFNDLFFELLRLYQKEVSELCGQISVKQAVNVPDNEKVKNQFIETGNVTYNDKDFFDYEKQLLQHTFEPGKSFDENQSQAVSLYMGFYIEHRTKMAAYFRTLYRIYDLIDSSKLNENSKKNYLKIIRAQLTESELFFLRYNSMSHYGNPFVPLLNKYHVFKHLPFFELLEFKDWWSKLSQDDRMGLNVLFGTLSKEITNCLERGFGIKGIIPPSKKYRLDIENKHNNDILLIFSIDKVSKNHCMEYKAFDSMEPKRIQQLFDCIVKEIFDYSNFKQLNSDLEFYSENIQYTPIVVIKSGVRNKKGVALKTKYSFK